MIQGASATSETIYTKALCFCLIGDRRLLKKYGPLSGLLIKLKKIISSPKWANAWLEVQVDELDWYVIIGIFWKRN